MVLKPQPSRLLRFISGACHFLAGIAVLIASVPFWLKAIAVVGIGGSLARCEYRYGHRYSAGFISSLHWSSGCWHLEMGDGMKYRAQLISAYSHPLVVILDFRQETTGQRWSLVLLPDAMSAESRRQLRVWLKSQWVPGPDWNISG
ncbi:MAG: hypothetical protein CSA09_03795 [Candidatus Contendobacter odensis]|uniref:Toxin CptA n=1 Tax=Candidatus Contendibacter odensensis TaxID=1400860 RepID=A0A2G6PEP1_9GAMM|nr:MAG: hypothetical protein CSA09_03795 [Candidatus Contendobacter odensis]